MTEITYPVYMQLYQSGELQQRVRNAIVELAHCTLCPRACGVDRVHGKLGTCQIDRYARLTS